MKSFNPAPRQGPYNNKTSLMDAFKEVMKNGEDAKSEKELEAERILAEPQYGRAPETNEIAESTPQKPSIEEIETDPIVDKLKTIEERRHEDSGYDERIRQASERFPD